MSVLDSMKNRLGFNDGEPNWDSYDEYEDDYRDSSPRRRSASGGSRSLSFGNEDTIYENNQELMERYSVANSSVRTRSAGERRPERPEPHAPLVSYSDIRSQSPSFGSPRVSSTYDPYAETYVASRRGSTFNEYSPNVNPQDVMSRSGSNSLKELFAERNRMESTYADVANATGSQLPSWMSDPDPLGIDRGIPSGGAPLGEDPFGSIDIGAPRLSMRMPRKVQVVRPASYNDVEIIAKCFKGGDIVVLALAGTSGDLARRILDFSFGVASALDGTVECLADRTFLLIRGQGLSEDEREQLRREGIGA